MTSNLIFQTVRLHIFLYESTAKPIRTRSRFSPHVCTKTQSVIFNIVQLADRFCFCVLAACTVRKPCWKFKNFDQHCVLRKPQHRRGRGWEYSNSQRRDTTSTMCRRVHYRNLLTVHRLTVRIPAAYSNNTVTYPRPSDLKGLSHGMSLAESNVVGQVSVRRGAAEGFKNFSCAPSIFTIKNCLTGCLKES